MDKSIKNMSQSPVTLIIPVCSKTAQWSQLIQALQAAFPTAEKGMDFFFIQQKSSPVADLAQDEFFSREDVQIQTSSLTDDLSSMVLEASQLLFSGQHLLVLNANSPAWYLYFVENKKSLSTSFPQLALFLMLWKKIFAQRIFLMVLHANPDGVSPGGTERHVRMLSTELNKKNHLAIEMFPGINDSAHLLLRLAGQEIWQCTIHQNCLPLLLPLFESYVDYLHVHHLIGWKFAVIQQLAKGKFANKLMSIHDFNLLCPSTNLLKAPKGTEFCEVEKNLSSCNHCLKKFHGYKFSSIEGYREKTQALLQCFDHILVPSQVMQYYFLETFANDTLRQKFKILPHDLSYLFNTLARLPAAPAAANKTLFVFIGSLSLLKGYSLITQVVPKLQQLGFEVEIWGNKGAHHPNLTKIKTRAYTHASELRKLFIEHKPAYAIFPSLTAESFSYVFFETLILGEGTLPIVSKWGHPADIVKTTKAGVVISDLHADGVISACQQAQVSYDDFIANKPSLLAALKESTDYIDHYLNIVNTDAAHSFEIREIDFDALLLMDQQSKKNSQKENNRWYIHLYRIGHVVRTHLRNPSHLLFFIGKAREIFRHEGISGLKHRLNKMFSH